MHTLGTSFAHEKKIASFTKRFLAHLETINEKQYEIIKDSLKNIVEDTEIDELLRNHIQKIVNDSELSVHEMVEKVVDYSGFSTFYKQIVLTGLKQSYSDVEVEPLIKRLRTLLSVYGFENTL